VFRHLLAISDERGVFEHCSGDIPLPEHGYCVDDVARALIVVEREPTLSSELEVLANTCIQFLAKAQSFTGEVTNRCDIRGEWHGAATVEDHWGRAIWAWGTVVGRSANIERIAQAQEALARSATLRSPHLRSMSFAALGAAEVLRVNPSHQIAKTLLEDAADRLVSPAGASRLWPEDRLTYANAIFPEVLLLAGLLLGRPEFTRRGMDMLAWLLNIQTHAGHLSIIPCTGWTPSVSLPAFDQQAIEVAALVDACMTAYRVTGDGEWLSSARDSAMWFYGANDGGEWMHDPLTGAGYDGLQVSGRNDNRGAESTLAFLSVLQQSFSHSEVA